MMPVQNVRCLMHHYRNSDFHMLFHMLLVYCLHHLEILNHNRNLLNYGNNSYNLNLLLNYVLHQEQIQDVSKLQPLHSHDHLYYDCYCHLNNDPFPD